MLNELIAKLHTRGATFVKVVDISMLSSEENRGYNVGVLIGIALSPSYVLGLSSSKNSIVDHSEFSEKERDTDNLADWTADYLLSKGYKAFAQSERNLLIHGFYDEATKSTPLPHKKIAIMAGFGWIGKNNLLITQEYGCAFSMCSVLTNAQLPTEDKPIIRSKCGECSVCKDICAMGAIHGSTWDIGMNRDLIVDVYNCDGCLKCLASCAWTQKYIRKYK